LSDDGPFDRHGAATGERMGGGGASKRGQLEACYSEGLGFVSILRMQGVILGRPRIMFLRDEGSWTADARKGASRPSSDCAFPSG